MLFLLCTFLVLEMNNLTYSIYLQFPLHISAVPDVFVLDRAHHNSNDDLDRIDRQPYNWYVDCDFHGFV